MKTLYACGDVHDDTAALQGFASYVAAQGADHILFNGDFSLRPYTAEQLADLMQSHDVPKFITAKRATNLQQLTEMKRILTSTKIPFSVVPGNYDPSLEDIFETDLHRKTTTIGDAKVFGYGGSDAGPMHIDLLVRKNEIIPFNHQQLFLYLHNENPAIALIHNPPLGLCDDMFDGRNVGTPATTKYIVEGGLTKLVISGHIHEAGPLGANPHNVYGVKSHTHANGNKTVVVNPGNLGRFELMHHITLKEFKKFNYGTFARIDIEDDGTPLKVTQYSLRQEDGTVGTVREIRTFDKSAL